MERAKAIIDVPLKLVRKQEQLRQKRAANLRDYFKKYGVDKRRASVLIACKDREYNHFLGMRYPKEEIPLVSQRWRRAKWAGDYFVLNQYGKNPSVLTNRIEDAPEDFSRYNFAPEVEGALASESINFKRPTLIQSQVFSVSLSGRNILLAAETGSGKTLAFTAPLLHHVLKWKQANPELSEPRTPRGLIMAPGKELAEQIGDFVSHMADFCDLKVKCVTGGGKSSLGEEPVDVLVGTPGVLSSLVRKEELRLSGLGHVVVDEADTLLDDSFSPLILQLLAKIKIQVFSGLGERESGAQLILSSATFPQDLQTILCGVVDTDNLIHVVSDNLHRLMPHVTQKFLRVTESSKLETLLGMAKRDCRDGKTVLVFGKDSKRVHQLWQFLCDGGLEAGRLMGRMEWIEREEVFQRFLGGQLRLLVATDIASRGLDTINVDHVILADFPSHLSDYIHRVGRVGRVGSSPSAHVTSLVSSPRELQLVQTIEEAARRSVYLPKVDANISRQLDDGQDRVDA